MKILPRKILRQAARPPVIVYGRRTTDAAGRTLGVTIERADVTWPAIFLDVRLPDARPESARRSASQKEYAFRCPTVLVTCRLTVWMDDLAWEGLLRTMERTGKTHQEAARWLVRNARAEKRAEKREGRQR